MPALKSKTSKRKKAPARRKTAPKKAPRNRNARGNRKRPEVGVRVRDVGRKRSGVSKHGRRTAKASDARVPLPASIEPFYGAYRAATKASRKLMRATWRILFKPRYVGNVHTWAESHRIIQMGPVPGKWVSRPYQQPPMEAMTQRGVEAVMYLAASQGGGKTEIALNAVGYFMDAEPSAIMVVEPTLDMADALSKDRIAPMIAASPVLSKKVQDPRSRDSGNTTRHKVFTGGHVTMVGANSAAGLSMRPVRVVIFDEYVRYPLSAGTEGDSIRLATARTFAYAILGLAKLLFTSSPGRMDSRGHQLWLTTDQCEYMVPCPACKHRQVLKWAQVKWAKDKIGAHLPHTAVYQCEKCGANWDDATRWAAVRAAPGASPTGDPYEATAEFHGWKGYRLPGMCVLGSKLSSFVKQWLEAQGNPELLRVFVNTVLCEWENVGGEAIDETGLLARREEWKLPKGRELPYGVAILTVGIDFQGDYAEYEIVGWGRGEESWSIEHGKIYGSVKDDASVFDDIDKLLARGFTHAKGHKVFIRAASLDSGYATQAVYKYCKPRITRVLPNGQRQFVFCIKGRSEHGRPLWPETGASGKKTDLGTKVNLWTLGVDAGKDQVMARLSIVEPGPGYCHFPLTRLLDYFLGLTAERCRMEIRAGVERRVWSLKTAGQPNEPFDCRVYAYAALVGLSSRPFLLDLEAEVDAMERLPELAVGAEVRQAADSSHILPPGARRKRSKGYEA